MTFTAVLRCVRESSGGGLAALTACYPLSSSHTPNIPSPVRPPPSTPTYPLTHTYNNTRTQGTSKVLEMQKMILATDSRMRLMVASVRGAAEMASLAAQVGAPLQT